MSGRSQITDHTLPPKGRIAALFPRKDDLDGIERIALSFGLSIAVVPLTGLALNYTPFGIRLVPILAALSVFTVSLAVIAYLRRRGFGCGGGVCVVYCCGLTCCVAGQCIGAFRQTKYTFMQVVVAALRMRDYHSRQ